MYSTPQRLNDASTPWAPRANRTPHGVDSRPIPFNVDDSDRVDDGFDDVYRGDAVYVIRDMATINPAVYSGYTLVSGNTRPYKELLNVFGG